MIEAMAATTRASLLRIPQPRGVAARRPMSRKSRDQTAQRAEQLFNEGVIFATAKNYLCDWVKGTRALQERPPRFSFSCHRWQTLGEEEMPVPASCPNLPTEAKGQRRLQARVCCVSCHQRAAEHATHRFESWDWEATGCLVSQKNALRSVLLLPS